LNFSYSLINFLVSCQSLLGSRPWPFRVTWRHQSCDHWTRDGPFPIGGPLDPSLYP